MRLCFSLFFILVGMHSSLYCIDADEIGLWINGKRREGGLPALLREESLASSARSYTTELFERGQLSHRDRENRGPWERYKALGGTALAAGEILGTCSSDAPGGELLEAWWNSDGHRYQIMNPRWTCFGISLEERDGILIAAVEFSSSLITQYSFTSSHGRIQFLFTPLPGVAELGFYEPLHKKVRIWTKGEKGEWLFDETDFPLLLEIRREGEDTDGSEGNRILLLEPPDPVNQLKN